MSEKKTSDLDPRSRLHVDQDALNFGSQSAATTVTASTQDSHSRFRSGTAQSSSEAGRDTISAISAYTYRSDVDALRLFRQIDGRVRKKVAQCTGH
jgi:hypothetical protein